MTTARLTREEVLRVASKARAEGKRPDLSGADLSGAYLSGADLSGAYLRGTDLSGADLSDANLSDANLSGAYLRGTGLTGAYLSGAYLTRAYLSGARWSGVALDGLHHYRCLLIPTPDGWVTEIGCWSGTLPELRELVAGDDWPESGKHERERLRPLLRLWCDLAEAHADSRPRVIPDLAKRWGES